MFLEDFFFFFDSHQSVCVHDVHGWVEGVRRRRRMEVRVHERADDRERSSRRGRTNKQQEGDQKIKMLASGDKGAIEEEVLRFLHGEGVEGA